MLLKQLKQQQLLQVVRRMRRQAVVPMRQHFGLSYAYGEMQVFDHMPKWFESVMKFMMPNQEVAFMQKFMTIVEVCIALALIAGLFTWLSSAATIGLTIAFCYLACSIG